ncbi:hypothetical protein FHQ18_02450 [Deferribacter autotrophicus]|uniref:Porin family protein n=1 Tax=Deferribacter autotrophicus TaxID=500465 RepID=A0A5A8F6G9_9BACT|nr:hypothetical protein [Deferribacter autotrophicus]KAA0258829.1 hypothetical protein FHQ18_02450 [Deferribacter autotrophicus]
MKKNFYFVTNLLLICAFLLILNNSLFADGYISIGGGYGGENNKANISIDGGIISTYEHYRALYGVGLGYIFLDDEVPENTLDYPVPHSDYTYIGTKNDGGETLLFGKFGIEIVKNSGFFVYGLGGISYVKEIELAQSNATGWYYTQSEDSKTHGVYGAGIGYFPINKGIVLMLDFDNRRGITGGIGYKW